MTFIGRARIEGINRGRWDMSFALMSTNRIQNPSALRKLRKTLPDLPLFDAHTPEHLIAGIFAGLIIGIDEGDCGCCVGGFGVMSLKK